MNALQFGPTLVSAAAVTGLPLSGPITSRFGEHDIAEHAGGHTGVDIGAIAGTPVLAPAPGVVLEAIASNGVFGTYIALRHAGSFVSLFAHLSRLDVAAGQRVMAGTRLGLVGMTGLTTGPHLHWGLAEGGSPLVAGPHLRDALAFCSPAPARIDRERLLRGVAFGLLGALQSAGALFDSHETADFDGYLEGSPERQVLAIQQAADPFLAQWARLDG